VLEWKRKMKYCLAAGKWQNLLEKLKQVFKQKRREGISMKAKFKIYGILFIGLVCNLNLDADTRQTKQLTLDSMVDIAINSSYQTKRLEYEIRSSLHWLRAQQAGLKTQIYMNLLSPDLRHISEHRWNSTLLRDEIVRLNTQHWESDLSVKYPLIFWGYPTNGYLSLNYQIYKYTQKDHIKQTDFYNRLYLKFEQPFFLPNELKNDLEEAELNFKDIKLDYIGERVEIIEDISDDFYRLFRLTYYNQVFMRKINYLNTLKDFLVSKKALYQSDNTDLGQIQLELANVQELMSSNQSALRQSWVSVRQRLRIKGGDSLFIIPEIKIISVHVDLDQAIDFGYANDPQLQRLNIRKRRAELDVDNQKGRNAFHVTLEMTYGLEKGDPRFNNLWDEFDNSNSIKLNAYIPIWDGGQRRERIQAEKVGLERSVLDIEEEKNDKKNDIITAYTNVKEYHKRAETMLTNMQLAQDITDLNIEKFKEGQITIQDILQIIDRTRNTDENFIDVYLDYRLALLDLMTETYYNYEKNISLYDEFNLRYE
jgi:outer membrane protein